MSSAEFPGNTTYLRRFFVRLLAWTAVVALSSATAHADPALWVVKGPHAKVYLFGTVHVLPPGRAWRTLKIDQAMRASSALWLEVTNADDESAIKALIQQFGVDTKRRLSSKLTRDEFSKVDAAARTAGMRHGEADVELMRPWLAALTLSMAPVQQAGYNIKGGVELVLKPEFERAGKPVHAFETMTQQVHLFADLPQREEVRYLDATVRDYDRGPRQLSEMVNAWYKGDEAALDTLMEGEFREQDPAIYRRILVERNLRWMPTLTALAQANQTVFVAVGAGHLVGPDGLVAMLRKAGYQVDRL